MKRKRTTWFHNKMRCDKRTFLAVVALVKLNWVGRLRHNTKFNITKRVAVTLLYLSTGGTIAPREAKRKTADTLTRNEKAIRRHQSRRQKKRQRDTKMKLLARTPHCISLHLTLPGTAEANSNVICAASGGSRRNPNTAVRSASAAFTSNVSAPSTIKTYSKRARLHFARH
ncbi:uncharacterized protein IUM83_07188 [Phytophthora cinnamomi]|uniref:uncharacterized protein n=1 Tax=Phytophthora cinnamomi TaxID=4785 RepID=UPI00355AB43D|nr:hypothetical protein IUM83_07188 [Phytophthora cinnamomi]